MEALKVGEKFVAPREWDPTIEFIIDLASAYCGDKGGRGTMQIPVPPGASRVTHFRICGTTNRRLEIEWVRGGWNSEHNKGDHKILAKRVLDRAGNHEHFDDNAALEDELQRLTDSHTLAISVIAEGTTNIWLVAARFE
jgi:hypothetical protein